MLAACAVLVCLSVCLSVRSVSCASIDRCNVQGLCKRVLSNGVAAPATSHRAGLGWRGCVGGERGCGSGFAYGMDMDMDMDMERESGPSEDGHGY
jgi:hypothetical protein